MPLVWQVSYPQIDDAASPAALAWNRSQEPALPTAEDGRPTQLFINFGDNSNLDGQGFAPFGQVVSGMKVVDSLYNGYGEGAPQGRGPDQSRVQSEGNAYLASAFPNLDYIKKATIVP